MLMNRRDGDALIGILPSRCKLDRHDLAVSGHRSSSAAGLVQVTCSACAAIPIADHTWTLRAGARPDRIELDQAPYAGIDPLLIERPIDTRNRHAPDQ